MVRYYWRVLLGVPKALWDASDIWSRLVQLGLIAGSIIPWATDAARANLAFWWIAPVSFGALVLFGLARLNYREMERLERRASNAERRANAAEASLREAQDRRPVLEFGPPMVDGQGALVRTEVRGDRQTGVGWEGQVGRHVKFQRRIVNYRVPITNRGAGCDIRVKVVEIDPKVDGVRLPIKVHVAGDDPPPNVLERRFKDSFHLARDDSALLDVVARDLDDAVLSYLWNVEFEDAVQEVGLERTYRLKLKAYADDATVEEVYEVNAPPGQPRLEMKGPLPRSSDG
jgi:hypothetical protein